MFEFGFSEMFVVGIVALVVLGPERLPVVARTAGEWVGKAQRFVAQVKADINRETELSELKKIQEEAQAIAGEVKSDVEAAAKQIEQDARSIAGEVNAAGSQIEKEMSSASEGVQEAADAVKDAVPAATATPEDLANVYGWGGGSSSSSAPAPSSSFSWQEPKTFAKRYHSGPSVDELAQEIERLRRELGMRETRLGGAIGRRRDMAPRARSNRARIYR